MKINEYKLSGFDYLHLLEKLTIHDIEKETELCFQVSPVIQKLVDYSRIRMYLDDEEETILLNINQTDFFSKIMYISKLAQELLDDMILQQLFHPLIDVDMALDVMFGSQEECISELFELQNFLEEDNHLYKEISHYYDITVGNIYEKFLHQILPKLIVNSKYKNYDLALTTLSKYIKIKLLKQSGIYQLDSLYLFNLEEKIHKLMNESIVEYIIDQIDEEEDSFDPDELDDDEYFNLLILKFENRYFKQKICQYYYQEMLDEADKYQQYCKKM